MRRIAVVISTVVALIGFSVTLGGAAWGATVGSSSPVITFDDAAHEAQLTIPTPACPEAQPNCQWKFFLNEPKLSVDVAVVYGTSGTLSIPYPPDFCGVIQADAYVGPPWVAKRGFQHTIDDCNPPATTTTTLPPPPPPTPSTPTTTTTTVTIPSTVIAVSAPPPAPPAAPPPSPSVVTPVSTVPTQLPFTGRDLKPFLYVGLTLLVLGLGLLASSESWRRVGRRLGAIGMLRSPASLHAHLRRVLLDARARLLAGLRLVAGRVGRVPSSVGQHVDDLASGMAAAFSMVATALWPWGTSTPSSGPFPPSAADKQPVSAWWFPVESTVAGSRHRFLTIRGDTRVLPGSAALRARARGQPRAPALRRCGLPRFSSA